MAGSFVNRDGAEGTMAAMQAAARPHDSDTAAVDPFARVAAVSAHERLDDHDARLAALEGHGSDEPVG